jgi:acetyltransferase-like isoleucine patch superfamily enzyme
MTRLVGFSKIILDLKIYLKINFIYPYKKNTKHILSIVPSRINNIGEDVVVEDAVDFGPFLESLPSGLYIGKRTMIGYCRSIGKYTSISYDVKIGLTSHPSNLISTSPLFYSSRRGWLDNSTFNEVDSGFVEIGNDVLISANVVILAGVKIGNGAIIGAGAIVNKDVAPYSIVAGVPARLIRFRFPNHLIDLLEKAQYWNLSRSDIMNFKQYFTQPEVLVNILLKNDC